MAIRDELIREFEEREFSLQQAYDLGFKRGSISSALSRGVKTDNFERIDRGIYKGNPFYEKLLGTQHYCNNKLKSFLARTIENNNTNRETELLGALEAYTINCSPARKTWKGYQSRITKLREPRFSEVEVIET